MQTTSELYKELLANGARKEVRVEIAGEVYGEDKISSLFTTGSLFSLETLCVGSAVARQIDLVLRNYGTIPRMAKLVPSYRLVLNDQVSEWIQKGVFYIDTREPDKISDTLTIHGFDDMLKGSVIWEPDQSLVFPMTCRKAVQVISGLLGVELDNPEAIDDTDPIVDYPANDYTQRNVLQFIAAAHAANFVMTDLGKLRMVGINDIPVETGYLVTESGRAILFGGIRIKVAETTENNLSGSGEKIYVGGMVASTGAPPAFDPISQIIVKVDDENAYFAGDDTGHTLEVTCPYGTQAMADNILSKVKGFVYRPFTAEDALVDQAIELGDGIAVDGVYTILAQQEITFDGLMAGRVAAPGQQEVESEYPYQTKDQQIDLKIAQTRSLISKTAEAIRQEIVGLDGRVASAELTIDGFTVTTTNEDGTKTVTLKNGIVTADAIAAGAVTADKIAAGAITAENITLTGAITWNDLSSGVQSTINGAYNSGGVSAEQVTLITQNSIATARISASQISTGALTASLLSLDGLLKLNSDTTNYGYIGVNVTKGGPVMCDSEMNVFVVTTSMAAKISYGDVYNIWTAKDGCYTSSTIQQYSDKRLKNTISYDLETEEKLFVLLRPCSFKMNNDAAGKKHWGFIAQDFVESVENVGLDADTLAVLGSYDGMNTIGYGEIAALNTHMIQKIIKALAETGVTV